MKTYVAAGMMAVVLAFAGTVVAAPPSPADVDQNRESIQDYYRTEKRLKDATRAKEAPDAVAVPEEGPAPTRKGGSRTLQVTEFITDPSEILTTEEIAAVTRPLEGRLVTVDELLDAVERLNALYREKGFVTARAILPPQTVEKGVVRLRLVEGRVGAVRIDGTRDMREDYLRNSLTLVPGDLVRVDRLETDLRRFMAVNQTPLMSEMVPGKGFGTTDLVIHVKEPKRVEAHVLADNLGRENTGEQRAGVGMTVRNILGVADSASMEWTESTGSRSVHLEYGVPFNYRGTRLSLLYDEGDVEIKKGEFRDLNLKGDSRTLGMSVSHLLWAGARSQMTAFTSAQLKESESDSNGFTLYTSRVHDYSGGLDWQRFDEGGLWMTHQEVTRGFALHGSRDNFWTLKGHLLRFQQLPDEMTLLLKGTYQLSNTHLLPSSDQFQLGGMATVRGYDEGLLVGDRGYLMSAELEYPLPLEDATFYGRPAREQLRGLLFVDHGGAFPFKGNGQGVDANDYLTSFGTGLRLALGERLSGRLIIAIPVGHQEDLRHEARIHFTLHAELL
ncbi:ShlB/FhaC/HecB family hemolysin secretion/activation protein [Desulfoluna sp.]|uniref:ShlB/FhaC/HecB family hemolysin secretion/activation protein n=1 Tax=Desulfoluna sp. TaxID=2045199 RepID=UPI00263166DA|nr:ShlB/FhaC/HecB family hemolysin secretion/activation protein [Desulfoluna sp.]